MKKTTTACGNYDRNNRKNLPPHWKIVAQRHDLERKQ